LRASNPEVAVSKTRYGVIVGVIGSVIGAWLLARQRTLAQSRRLTSDREDWEVIYANTPSAEGII
jgi:Na+/glutamate symporter